MLAHAHLCAASKEFREIRQDRQRDPNTTAEDDPRWESVGEHREKARVPLDIIRAHERSRESQPLAQLTDIGRSDRICREDWLSAIAAKKGQPLYTLQSAHANYRAVCQWLGVRIEPPDNWTEKPLYLHVWGGGLDERVPVKISRDPVDGRVRRPDPISLPLTRNRFYYIAQLEDAQQQPVSLLLFLKPPSEDPGPVSPKPPGAKPAAVDSDLAPGTAISGVGPKARCPNVMNLVQLTFLPPVSSATSAAATD
jgi:hypothetical protein